MLYTLNNIEHGENSFAHREYEIPLYTYYASDSNAGSNEWIKIIDQNFYSANYLSANKNTQPHINRFYATALLWGDYTDADVISGILTLKFKSTSDSAYKAIVDFLPLGMNTSTNFYLGEDICRMYTTVNGDGTFNVKAYLRYIGNFERYRLKVLNCDFIKNTVDFTANYGLSNEALLRYPNLSRQAALLFNKNESTIYLTANLPTTSGSVFMQSNTCPISSYMLSSLPTASSFWVGKKVVISTDEYTCRNTSGVYSWVLTNSPLKSITISTAQSTIDVSSLPAEGKGGVILFTYASGMTVTNFTGQTTGQIITLLALNAGTVIQHSSTINNNSGANITMGYRTTLQYQWMVDRWFQL